MKQYRNIVIVSNNNINFVSVTFENAQDEPVFKKYNNLPLKGTNAAANINALSIINKYLLEISKSKELSNMHYIIVPAKICKAIKEGTYKQWLQTGKYMNGNPVDETELRYWRSFMYLYKQLFAVVSFKPLTYYASVNSNYKHSVFIHDMINKAYELFDEEDDLMNSLDGIL
jgi:hypothetical protein